KELRIVNWVDTKYGYLQVFSVDQHGCEIVDDSGWVEYFEYDKINPIPLTEEMLLKCGFVKSENSLFFHKETNPVKFVISLNTYTIYFKYEGLYQPMIEIPYKSKHLHQLQNLYFSLTGQELE